LIACFAAVTDARAQTRSTLTGTITDGAGAPLAGAIVTLESVSLPGNQRRALTGTKGRYRFPELAPGLYELRASLNGLQPVKRTALRIPVGSTLTVDVVLGKSGSPDVVTIDGKGPVVDVTTAASTTTLTTEDLENLPIQGGIEILQVVPGVTPRTAFGSGGDTSQLRVDGGPVTFTDRTRARTAAFHVYWMEEAQIIGPGAGAEYGEFSGVVANIALRSGTNRLSGLVEYRISPPGWVGDNTGSLEETLRPGFRPEEIVSRWSSNAQAGGPIARDRLFFFAGFAYEKNKVLQAGTIGNVPRDERSPAFLTKLTWLPWRTLTVDGFVEADHVREVGMLSVNATPDTANDRTTRLRSWNARAVWTLDPETQVALSSGSVTLDFSGIPAARRAGPAPRIDSVTKLRSGNVAQYQDQLGTRYLTSGSLTRFLDHLGGSHTLRAGFEVERTTYRQVSGSPGGRFYTDDVGGDPDADTVDLWDGDHVTGTGTRSTLFAQDAWGLAGRITIHPGVRLGIDSGSVPDKGRVFRTTPVSPRIGAAWDVKADHKTVVRGSFGRIHEGLFTPVFDFMNTAGRSPKITANVLAPDTFVPVTTTTPDGRVAVDDNLRHAFVDQYVVGVERELFPDVSLVVQYIGRRFGDIWAMTDTGSRYEQVEKQDPGPNGKPGDGDDGAPITVSNLLNADQVFTVLTNPDDAWRQYHAVQAIAQKRFSRNWQFLGAYTWSRTRGNVNAANQESRAQGMNSDTGFGGVFFNPNKRINAEGPVSFDYTHQLNLQGVYQLPAWGGVGLSATYRFLSGGAAGRTAVIRGLNQGNPTVRVEPRGTWRIEGASTLDLRVEKTFPLGRSARTLGMYTDLLNITNEGVPMALTIDERSGESLGDPLSWAAPRAVRIAGRFKF